MMLPLGADDPRMVGEFRLHARLGAGGMGRVYLGHSPGGRAVAVKVVHPHLARDAAFVDRFRREVAAARAVNGSYAAPVVAAGPDDDPPWLATAYVPGPSLADVVTAAGPLPEDAVLKLAAGLAEALRVIHSCGLVHRDLKPGNVLLAPDGPRVIDFGIARALDGTVLTSADSVLGTPSYMSPEQAQGKPAGPASDVFSLGGVAYFAATGANPFGTGHPAVMLYRIVHTEPDLEPLPPRLRDLIGACMAKDPAHRPSPAELCAALMDVVPPGNSPVAFWPASVDRLIHDYQAGRPMVRLDSGSPIRAGQTPVTIRAGQTPDTIRLGPTVPVPMSERGPGAGPGLGAGPDPGLESGAGPGSGPGRAMVPGTGIERRRALAALAGAATGGLAVAVWELTRPAGGHSSAAGQLASQHRAARPGDEVWRYEASDSVDYLAVAGGVVYAGTGQNTAYALDAATGKRVWWRATTTTDNSQLVVADGAVVIADPTDGGVLGLDAATGSKLWSKAPGTTGSGGVLGLAADGDSVFCGYAANSGTTGGVTAFGAATGTLLWTTEFEQDGDINGGLAAASGTVYATTANGEIYAYHTASGIKRWRLHGKGVKFGGNASPLASGDAIYVCSSNNPPVLYAVRTTGDGAELWQQPLDVSDDASWLAVSDRVLFVGDTDNGGNAGYLAARNTAHGHQLWKKPVTGGVFPVAAADNVVYSGSNNGVLDAWRASNGDHLWSYTAAPGPVNNYIACNIVVAGGVVYFGSNDHYVYAVAAQ
jgi:serine/threonine protein kinase/outer membrane protein assembly factor BamB